jgi:putative PIN family toxin of toxin-antitoxin system
VLSALLFSSGQLPWLRPLWRDPLYLPCVSRETVLELLRVLAYPKFRLAAEEQELLLSDYLPYTQVIPVTSQFQLPECRDSKDKMFLSLALAAKAEALVTGDADLLSLAGLFSIPILTAEQLRQRLVEEGFDSGREQSLG